MQGMFSRWDELWLKKKEKENGGCERVVVSLHLRPKSSSGWRIMCYWARLMW